MADSRLEGAMDNILSAFRGITTANGYRNDAINVVKGIRPPDVITVFPEIGVEFGQTVVSPKDDARAVFDEITEVYVVAVVSPYTDTSQEAEISGELYEALESMAHDLRKCIATSLLKTYVTSATNKWNVELSENRLVLERFAFLGVPGNLGAVQTKFSIRVRALDSSFDD
jgi:hypothetical protein